MLTKDQILKILPNCPKDKIDMYIDPLTEAFIDAQINSSLRIAMFLAQVGHESSHLKVFEENLNYSADGLLKTFPKYYTAQLAAQHARNPQKIANHVYANRMGNGNEASGDGWKFRGKGAIQVTGKENTKKYSDYTGIDFISNPEDLLQPIYIFGSAAWFWKVNNLNKYADLGDVKGATKIINGGTNGLDDRQAIYNRAKQVLGIL